ncbi:hypothetical protein EW146_g9876 [Bondarzewia mesenterica]|uniref:DAGKc domain-containing protein n=1 Tax=Bondarzewia mesenterica TaxID=1095465 RepID=A0A4S4L2N8_9AGAM|nr:hypothetical protein EW146_g9876 [Bondarzewia mesenterica]
MPLLVLYNPVSGSASGKQITEQRVLPLLAEHHKIADQISSTEHAGHAGQLVLDFIDEHPTDDEGTLDVILVSGDGTLHEIVNALHDARAGTDKALPKIRLALVAAGTANALYSSLFPSAAGSPLFSLTALLSPLTASRLPHPRTHHPPPSLIQSNRTHIRHLGRRHLDVPARVHPPRLRNVAPADARHRAFQSRRTTECYAVVRRPRAPPPAGRNGPFAYFLTTVNVDRLEPRSASPRLRAPHPPSEDAIDVVVVRPSLLRLLRLAAASVPRSTLKGKGAGVEAEEPEKDRDVGRCSPPSGGGLGSLIEKLRGKGKKGDREEEGDGGEKSKQGKKRVIGEQLREEDLELAYRWEVWRSETERFVPQGQIALTIIP